MGLRSTGLGCWWSTGRIRYRLGRDPREKLRKQKKISYADIIYVSSEKEKALRYSGSSEGSVPEVDEDGWALLLMAADLVDVVLDPHRGHALHRAFAMSVDDAHRALALPVRISHEIVQLLFTFVEVLAVEIDLVRVLPRMFFLLFHGGSLVKVPIREIRPDVNGRWHARMLAMSRKKWEKLIAGLVAAVFLLILSRVSAAPAPKAAEEPVAMPVVFSTTTNALVIRAVDGDTVEAKLDSGEEVKVRLLGVNTPESVDPRRPVECFGKEASKHTASLVGGKRVRLEADPQADEVDKYGRLLRNIFLEDGADVNASLVRDGYAYAYLDFPLNKQRKVELARLQDEAEAAKRGLWNPEICNGQK